MLLNCTLHGYQQTGLDWLMERWKSNNSCILADEMGLGKTLQAIALIANVVESNLDRDIFGVRAAVSDKSRGPFMIVCPLSVVANWHSEFTRFTPALKTMVYTGDADERIALQQKINSEVREQDQRRDPHLPFDVLITSYEIVLRDMLFLRMLPIRLCVIDEAHRLKNSQSALVQALKNDYCIPRWLLLTGTPFQNTVMELFSLLNFVAPGTFGDQIAFRARFGALTDLKDGAVNQGLVSELQSLIRPFVLRRLKSDVNISLPPKRELVLFAGLSALQKKFYRWILTKNVAALGAQNSRAMTNVIMQLRKCCNHPYLFAGAEPEPFAEGDHLFENSGKFVILQSLLPYLKKGGHRVLLFSTSVQSLDICQDYLSYAGYSFERLDGSVRGDERHARVQGFNRDSDTFVFLLSTRAGGVGLNLTAADTVIFLDSDFNVQMDLQAAARVHRLGQTRPVTVIRLVARGTIEEIILRRSVHKLQRTEQIVDSAHLHGAAPADSDEKELDVLSHGDLKSLISFGLADIWTSDASTITEADIESLLNESTNEPQANDESTLKKEDASVVMSHSLQSSLYYYDADRQTGDSPADTTSTDILDQLVLSAAAGVDTLKRRRDADPVAQEAKRQKVAEAAEKRKAAAAAKREALWSSTGYVSSALPEVDIDDEPGLDDMADESAEVQCVHGDVTKPVAVPDASGGSVILACVDNWGSWGRGGFFTALSRLSPSIASAYELAGEMEDLQLGQAHLIDIGMIENRQMFVALLITQSRNKEGTTVSGVQLDPLLKALHSVGQWAANHGASIHSPRLGWGTANFNWYGVERSLRQVARKAPVFVYYFRRSPAQSNRSPNASPALRAPGTSASPSAMLVSTCSAQLTTVPTSSPSLHVASTSIKSSPPSPPSPPQVVSSPSDDSEIKYLSASAPFQGQLSNIFSGLCVVVAYHGDASPAQQLGDSLVSHGAAVVDFQAQSVLDSLLDRVCICVGDVPVNLIQQHFHAVVSPDWVTRCVQAGWRLDTRQFQL